MTYNAIQPPVASTEMGALVRRIASVLDEQEILWVVLRSAETLPESTRYDIDLLISAAQLPAAGRAIVDVAAALGWTQLATIRKHHYTCLVLVSPGGRYLPIDLVPDCSYRGVEYADAAYALANRRRVNGIIWTVPPGFEAATTAIKELLPHGTLKENSREQVQRGATDDAAAFIASVRSSLGEELAAGLHQCCREGNWEALARLTPALRAAVNRRWGQRLGALPGFLAGNLRMHLRPEMSFFLAVIGPDGCGKTTIAEQVCRRMHHEPFKGCVHQAFSFQILPELRTIAHLPLRLAGRRSSPRRQSPPGTLHSGMQPPISRIRAMINVAYHAADLALGRFILARWRSQSRLVVFARYYYDYYYQRGYAKVPHWYLRLFESLIPKPDLLIHLERDAAQIYAQKPELSVEEIERQQQQIRKLVESRAFGVEVDANPGVEATVQQVMRLILDRISR